MGMVERLAWASDRFYDRIRSGNAASAADAEPTGTIDDLRGHKYCLVLSYRKNGQPIPSPVWFGTADGKLYFNSGASGYKVKRIANNPEVRVAPCTIRGKPLGPPFVGRARLVPEADAPAAERAVQSNYGLGRRMYTAMGDSVETVFVEVTPVAPS
jgi:PPOX class probable F420-dependent enzyme